MKDKFTTLKKVIEHALDLTVAGDCSCEFQHYGCEEMESRHGYGILRNIINLKKLGDLNDNILKTGCEEFLYEWQYAETIDKIK
jgi:hypothetical protein